MKCAKCGKPIARLDPKLFGYGYGHVKGTKDIHYVAPKPMKFPVETVGLFG